MDRLQNISRQFTAGGTRKVSSPLCSPLCEGQAAGSLAGVTVHSHGVCCVQAKVALLGAAGGIGQPLALLLKMDHLVGELALYDVVNTPGVACDLSHLSTPAVVKGYVGQEQLPAALQGAQLVVIPAGKQGASSKSSERRPTTAIRACRSSCLQPISRLLLPLQACPASPV